MSILRPVAWWVPLCAMLTHCTTAQRPADAPSTPLRVSTWKQILRSPSSAAHVKFAQDAYECTTWDVDVHDFVQGVFRLDWSDILQEPREGSGKQYQQSVSEVQRFLEASKEAKTCGSNFELMNALSSQLYRTCGQKETICAMGRRKASENHAKNPGGKVLMPTYRGKVGIRTGEAVGEHCLKETLDLTYDKGEISIPRWEWAVAPMVMGAKGLSEALLKDGGGMFVALVCPNFLRLCISSVDPHDMVRMTQESRVPCRMTKPTWKIC